MWACDLYFLLAGSWNHTNSKRYSTHGAVVLLVETLVQMIHHFPKLGRHENQKLSKQIERPALCKWVTSTSQIVFSFSYFPFDYDKDNDNTHNDDDGDYVNDDDMADDDDNDDVDVDIVVDM